MKFGILGNYLIGENYENVIERLLKTYDSLFNFTPSV